RPLPSLGHMWLGYQKPPATETDRDVALDRDLLLEVRPPRRRGGGDEDDDEPGQRQDTERPRERFGSHLFTPRLPRLATLPAASPLLGAPRGDGAAAGLRCRRHQRDGGDGRDGHEADIERRVEVREDGR